MGNMMLSIEEARRLASQHATPLYVYDRTRLIQRAGDLLKLQLPFGLTVRYAVKANPHPEIIRMFDKAGLHFDASSSFEATQLLDQGVAGEKISLSSQQPAHNLRYLLDAGVRYIATSRHQLELFNQAAAPGSYIGLRINPGMGSGHNNRTTTGGVNSSFGIWHEYLEATLALASQYEVTVSTLHIHIGSGADPSAWGGVMDSALQSLSRMPDVTTLNIGGGFKVKRTEGETETDMSQVASIFAEKLATFANQTGRKIHLEIEPGSWLVAHAGTLLAEIVDIVDTGKEGLTFLRTNTGMNDFLRPTLYGAQHEIEVMSDASEHADYVVVGHNCETGDIITTAPRNPEAIKPRRLRKARIGDLLAIADAGAYCVVLSARGYNAFPSAKEVFINKENI